MNCQYPSGMLGSSGHGIPEDWRTIRTVQKIMQPMAKPEVYPRKEISLAAASGPTINKTTIAVRTSPLVYQVSTQGSMFRNIFTTGGNSYLQMNKKLTMAPRV